METFAHFEIFDSLGRRAAEGHKVISFIVDCEEILESYEDLDKVYSHGAFFAKESLFFEFSCSSIVIFIFNFTIVGFSKKSSNFFIRKGLNK